MKHDLDDFNYEIIIDKHLDESYNIKYYMPNSISFSFSNNKDIFLRIKENEQNLENLNKYMQLSHDLMKRLNNMGYEIAYFSNKHDYMNGLPETSISSNIRISRK